jgi:hypothetical protein
MEVTMNTKQLLENRQSVAGVSVPSMMGLDGRTVKNLVGTASVAAMIGLAVLTAGCAGPASKTPGATAEVAKIERFKRAENCYWLVRGKYTAWHCEQKTAGVTGKAVAKAP